MVGQCLVLVLRGEPAPLQLPRSYLAAAAMVCVGRCCRATAASVAVAAATVQQRQRGTGARQCRRRGKGEGGGTRFYGRACSIARPHRNREKPARRRGNAGVGVTEREMEREERARYPRQDGKGPHRARKAERGARCRERTGREREEGSVYSDTSHCHCCAWQKRNA